MSLLTSLPLMPADAAIRAGNACSKVGITSIYGSKKYTCIKLGKKLIWDKGVLAPLNSSNVFDWNSSRSTDLGYINEYNGWSSQEKNLSGMLKEIETAYRSQSGASGIFRVAKYHLGSARPTTVLTSNLSDPPINKCEISDPPNTRHRGFQNLVDAGRREHFNSVKIPGPKMVVQVIPIYTNDSAKPLGNPKFDYDVYFNFLESWAKYSSDGEENVQFRIPNEYLPFSKLLSNYLLQHENLAEEPENVRFVKDLIPEVDSKIDFSGANSIIIVAPPGTRHKVFKQAFLRDFNTNEAFIKSGLTQTPLTLTDLKELEQNGNKLSNFIVPYWWLHEFYHAGFGLNDHHGSWRSETEYGLGEWTLMSGNGGDLSAFEKWLIGFMTNSQVHCLDTSSTQTHWIAPSSVKTNEKKLIIIPISASKGIAIESIRPAGLYYKIPKSSNGVLIYSLDFDTDDPGNEFKLVLPAHRNADQPPTWLSQATLRQGESVTKNGFKISVVESGTYGDVIKVENKN